MRVARAFVVLAAIAAAPYGHAADFSAIPRPAPPPVANPLEIPPDIVNPAISETGD